MIVLRRETILFAFAPATIRVRLRATDFAIRASPSLGLDSLLLFRSHLDIRYDL